MPRVENAEQSSQSNVRTVVPDTDTGSTSQNGKSNSNSVGNNGTTIDLARVPNAVKRAAITLATNIAQQRSLLTKKPEGIQISRSKHWKFISSYHGPWLHLPREFLTHLAHVNESSRPPLQISPTIFSSVLQIRTLVEEATNLAVRAHNPYTGPHGSGRISRERQYRMYELAVEKLARAYALDEVATSVASMQSASAVEDVAGKLLERAKSRGEEPSRDARMLSESTSLIPLTALHQESPSSPHYLRTRAITRSLKGDFLPAIKDLSAALSLVKALTEHQAQSEDKGKTKFGSKGFEISPDMECQCVFQRGGCYLTLAIRYAGRVTKTLQKPNLQPGSEEYIQSDSDLRFLRTYARKAERDYLRFLSKVDYSASVDREDGANIVPLSTLFNHETENAQTELSSDTTVATTTNAEQYDTEPALTYHPLLPDALYSLLLALTLTLTPPQITSSTSPETPVSLTRDKERAELIRWAKTVARLQTICEGSPLFLPARSPARADWTELLRMSGPTLLSVPNWDTVLSSVSRTSHRKPPIPSKRDFSLKSKPESSNGAGSLPRPSTLDKDYPISTERATIVSRFVEEVIFGPGVLWDLSVVKEETRGKKKKARNKEIEDNSEGVKERRSTTTTT